MHDVTANTAIWFVGLHCSQLVFMLHFWGTQLISANKSYWTWKRELNVHLYVRVRWQTWSCGVNFCGTSKTSICICRASKARVLGAKMQHHRRFLPSIAFASFPNWRICTCCHFPIFPICWTWIFVHYFDAFRGHLSSFNSLQFILSMFLPNVWRNRALLTHCCHGKCWIHFHHGDHILSGSNM